MSSHNKVPRGSGKKLVGTIDQAIHDRKLFTALAKMPAEIQKMLIKNGWIGKITVKEDHFQRGDATITLSLHRNKKRAIQVVNRYESGLVWIDECTSGVNWKTLNPDVVVNRFPRNENATLKFCGYALVGKSEFDDHYPRAYRISTDRMHMDSFVADYSLTACVSLLRAFVDGSRAMCAKNGQAPLSALHFAAVKCHQYLTDSRTLDAKTFPGKGADWETFFKHYYMVVHEGKKFTVPETGDDVDAALSYLVASSKLIVNQITTARPQTAMDGNQNIWIVKDAVSQRHQPVMLSKIGDVLDRCSGVRNDDCIVQKYIETPLLRENVKSDVHMWIVLSTLGDGLTVWMHRVCAVQPYQRRFSLYRTSDRSGHFSRLKSGRLHGMVRSTALICSLKQLGTRIRRSTKTYNVQQLVNDIGDGGDAEDVYTAVRRSVVSAVTATVASGCLNLRPNCLELFRGTFVLSEDSRPWLIDIVSDDPCLAADYRQRNQIAPVVSRLARSVVQGVGMMLVDRGRGLVSRIGMFDKVHESPIPTGAKSYIPQLFTPPNLLAINTDRPRLIKRVPRWMTRASRSDYAESFNNYRWWNDEKIHTYIENITDEDVKDMQTPLFTTDLLTMMAATAKVHDKDLIAGSAENHGHFGPHESHWCLKLLNMRKTKIASIRKICNTIMQRDRNNKKIRNT